ANIRLLLLSPDYAETHPEVVRINDGAFASPGAGLTVRQRDTGATRGRPRWRSGRRRHLLCRPLVPGQPRTVYGDTGGRRR
ncbi:hypothetical protein chiPu_0025491, partial [Chiloscyllium punctatum]|nr:hypothetical protein [Chiloscyllium punctatum]